MDEFSGAMREAGVPIVSGLPLLRLCALLSLCGLYIGSDSGVSHLAAAAGIPAIAVFGPTDPACGRRREAMQWLYAGNGKKQIILNGRLQKSLIFKIKKLRAW